MDVPNDSGYLVDYHNGKPIKLDFEHKPNGDVWVSSTGYDVSNGWYRFLEALLCVFALDEIVMTEKDYPPHLEDLLDERTTIPDEELSHLKNILQHSVMYADNGIYWKIDTKAVNYKPPFMRGM